MTEQVEFLELSPAECLHLLATGAIGRVVFTEAALPAVQPVNYLLDGEEIVFRTRNGSKLAAAARNAVVGFQVDDFDLVTHTGWSVLGIGEAYEVLHPDRLSELAATSPDPWVPTHDAHTISIPLQRLSGRQLVLAERSPKPPPSLRRDDRDNVVSAPAVRHDMTGMGLAQADPARRRSPRRTSPPSGRSNRGPAG